MEETYIENSIPQQEPMVEEVQKDIPQEEVVEAVQEEIIPQVESIKKHAYDRIAQLQREKYQSQTELEYLRQQNSQLQQAAQATLATATNQYNETLVQRMARVKDEKIKAREEGDVDTEANADIALMHLTAEYNRTQALMPPPTQTVPQQNYTPPVNPNYAPVVEQWANQNTWFHPASPDYDPQLRAHIDQYCAAFDNNLRQGGRSDAIMSPEYLNLVSQEANRVRQLARGNQYGDLNMQQPRGNVSRVNPGAAANSANRTTIKLNPDQRDLARRLGVSEKDYIRFMMEDMKTQSQRGGR